MTCAADSKTSDSISSEFGDCTEAPVREASEALTLCSSGRVSPLSISLQEQNV